MKPIIWIVLPLLAQEKNRFCLNLQSSVLKKMEFLHMQEEETECWVFRTENLESLMKIKGRSGGRKNWVCVFVAKEGCKDGNQPRSSPRPMGSNQGPEFGCTPWGHGCLLYCWQWKRSAGAQRGEMHSAWVITAKCFMGMLTFTSNEIVSIYFKNH